MFRSAAWRATRPALVASASLSAAAVTLHEEPREKLSIYPEPEPEILLLDTPSQLEKQIGSIRRSLTSTYIGAHGRVQDVVSKWIEIEHAVEHRVKSLVSPTEPLTPGILYVGIAGLTGSIVARNRSIVSRVLLPPTLLVLAAHQFLPQTTENVSDYLGSLEDTYFPTLAQKHDTAKAHTIMGWEMLKDKTKEFRQSLGSGAHTIVDKVEDSTGLKFKETMGWGNGTAKPGPVLREVQKKVQEAKAVTVEKVEHGKEVVAAKAEEVKAFVEEKVEETKAVAEERVEAAKAVVEDKVEASKAAAEETAQAAEAKTEEVKEAIATQAEEPQEVKRLV